MFRHKQAVTILSVVILIAASFAAYIGITSSDGTDSYTYETIRGQKVEIYGKGLYKHMSSEVAVQGIAQDYVTLFLAVPLLLLSTVWARKNSLKARLLQSGTLGYFLVTYLFYLTMGMYNFLFLDYVLLLGTSFFAFTLSLLSFEIDKLSGYFSSRTPVKLSGGFLMFNAVCIALVWLGIVMPPLLNGTIFPREVEHYTTLIVQGFDLALLLPIAFVAGFLFWRKTPMAYLLAPVYLVFLSLLMTALVGKIIAMHLQGANVIPVVFIIPTFALVAIGVSTMLLFNVKDVRQDALKKELMGMYMNLFF